MDANVFSPVATWLLGAGDRFSHRDGGSQCPGSLPGCSPRRDIPVGRAEAPAGAGGVPGWGSPPRLSVLCTPGTPGRGSFGFSVRNPRGFFLPSRCSHFPPMSWLLRCCQLPESHKSTGPFKFAKLEKSKRKKKPQGSFFCEQYVWETPFLLSGFLSRHRSRRSAPPVGAGRG